MSAPAGRWPSALDAATVAAAGLRLAQPALHDGWVYWLEGRPREGGRVALQRRPVSGGDAEELAPAPASVRTRVHEYGGGAYLACDAGVFFVDDRDGRIWWRKSAGAAGAPVALTTTAGLRFADFAHDPQRTRLVAVVEDHRADPHRPRNSIVAIALSDGAVTELVSGRDFYASPRLAPDGATLAFLAWDLPAMPWDGAELWSVALEASGTPGTLRRRAGPAAFQPAFAAGGALWCSTDVSGRFVLGTVDGVARPDAGRECALPLWNLNMRCFGFADASTVVAASCADGLWQLRALDLATGRWRSLAEDLTQIDHVDAADGRVVALGGGASTPLGVHLFDLARGTREVPVNSTTLALDPRALSAPEAVRFAVDEGSPSSIVVHGLWWPPASVDHVLAVDERPPLLVRCHGGPTAAAASALDVRTLFWTSRGFAVLDVNYRGSWGYGRDYRRALDGAWGEADAVDAVAAAHWAIASGRADPTRIAITGASAGGLTALNASTLQGAPFRSAGSHYGLADLASAMTDTHKFESGYGERLLGPWPAARAVYRDRSPLQRLALGGAPTPTILFQGLDDRIVPPDQSARLVAALRARGGRVELHEYAGEGHGFRRATTITDALERELAFHLGSFDDAGAIR